MNLSTYSPGLVLLFVCALLWILMDIRYRELPKIWKHLAPILILALAVLNHFLNVWLGPVAYAKMILLTMHLPYFLIFWLMTKCSVIKMTFMIFTAVVFTAPTILVNNYVKLHVSSASASLLAANLLTDAAVLLVAQFVFRQGFNHLLKYAQDRFILKLFPVPFLYYVYMFAAMNLDFSSMQNRGGLVIRILPTVYVFVFYFLLLRVYKELDEKRDIEAAQTVLTNELESAKEQIQYLNESQLQTAIYQHNLRHHMTAIEGFLSSGNPEKAEEYIRKVQSDVEAITPKRCCENELVNLLCSSFSEKASRCGVSLSLDVTLPKTLSISDTELCSVMSNGLENALNAASAVEQTNRSVSLYGTVRMKKMLIEIKNPYIGECIMQNGVPISNAAGHGYGCRSIRSIVERNGGLCTFDAENGTFTLRIMLPMNNIE